ncbi:MAG TPA: DNA polymerase III subunit alpha [Polyangiaceae bacterium]|nr:DNA polymerase III subunit alpha [Polyangiaceae bacterium]
MPAEFVHLHVHTQYSFLLSTVKLGELAQQTKARGMRAVAVTDSANMFGAIRHYKKCKDYGLQAILGSELNVQRADGSGAHDHLVLLATNGEGYKNLVRLVSRGHTNSRSDRCPSVDWDVIGEHSQGLIGLTGCLGGVLAQQVMEHGAERAKRLLGELKDRFQPGHLFVELQDHALPEQPVVNGILSELASELELPTVASNDVHFLNRDDGEAYLYLECVRRNRQYQSELEHHHGQFEMYLKTPAEMEQLFGAGSEALKNTLKIAEMCSGLVLDLDKPMLPRFPVPEGHSVDSYFRHVSQEGLERRFAEFRAQNLQVDEENYRERLRVELDVIVGMQYPGYFLIVWDFIREAKARGIPVGPGRGSGAGSLVAYALGITALDPLPYDLLFERFLNPERVSMPDFDVDFCMSRRDEVIQYVAQKYGQESVGQIATFQNLKARSVIKDVARTMGISPVDSQRIASLVPDLGQGKTATIAEALQLEPKLKGMQDNDERIRELLKQASKLEGLSRHAGMHAAGVVISDGPLYDHVPVFTNDGSYVTQYDKDDVESAGLVKFDFLGLKTLTVIDIAERLVNARPDRRGRPLNVAALPLDDTPTFQLISSGDTTGVFQLESSGMQNLLRSLKPDCFEDVVAVVALYRPGPLGTGMIDDFIAGKHKKKEIRKLHPLVDAVLAPTYGVPVYQEQVMQIAQKLAGFSLGGADLLRRAMGKKKAEVMAQQQKVFTEGAKQNGVDEQQAIDIFKEIEGFASYGFNKSHSAAYAVITYQTAYLKAHYPAEFFAALMTADKDKIDKVVRMIAEARAWGVSVLPPDVNASDIDFTVVYQSPEGRGRNRANGKLRDPFLPQIRFGLGAVRGVGSATLEAVFAARTEGGIFKDLFDLVARVDARKLNKGVLEALIQCGALDASLQERSITRARALAAVDVAMERSRQATRDRSVGQTSLFGLLDAKPGAAITLDTYPPATKEWDQLELLAREKAALGCYVTGHPLHRYGSKLTRIGSTAAETLSKAEPWSVVSMAGIVESYQEKVFKGGGGKAAFFELEDMTGRVKAKLRGDRVETYGHILTNGEPVLITGKVSFPMSEEASEELEPTLLVDEVVPLSDAVRSSTRSVRLRLSATEPKGLRFDRLKDVLQSHIGACPVEMVLSLPNGAEAQLALDGLKVDPGDGVLSELERLFGGYVAELR